MDGFFKAKKLEKVKTKFTAKDFDDSFNALYGKMELKRTVIRFAENECTDDKTAFRHGYESLTSRSKYGGGRAELAEANFRGNAKITKKYLDYTIQEIETRKINKGNNLLIIATRVETIVYRIYPKKSASNIDTSYIASAKVNYNTHLEEKQESENN